MAKTWTKLSDTQTEMARTLFKDIFKDTKDIDTITIDRGYAGYLLFASTVDGEVINQMTIATSKAEAILAS